MDLLRGQHWVASVSQLGGLGVSRQAVWTARRAGLVTSLARGVVGVTGACETFESHAMTAQLAVGGRGALSGTTAGRLHGLRRMPRSPIEVTVHETIQVVVPSWVRLHKTSWLDDEAGPARRDGLVVTSPLRTLFDLAAELDDRRFELAAEDAWHLGLVDPASAAAYLARIRRRGRSGVATFEAWLERALGQSRPATTGLEQLAVDLCRRAGLPEPERQHPLVLRNGERIHLDVAWPDLRLAIEPGHTWWHGGNTRMREDQERDRACGELGWMVVRFDETMWDDRDGAVEQLRRIHRARCQMIRPVDD